MMGKTSLDLSQGMCRYISEDLAERQHLVEETMARPGRSDSTALPRNSWECFGYRSRGVL